MNKYYIVFEVRSNLEHRALGLPPKESKTITHGEIKETIYDMNTYKGLVGVIEDLQEEYHSPVTVISWKHLK